jgi:hypothetical protein
MLEVMYSEICVKWNLGQKTVTFPRIWNLEDPNLKYLYEMEPACNRKKNWSLAVPL